MAPARVNTSPHSNGYRSEKGLPMPNQSSTAFDAKLKDIPHYKAFPAMLPFVGRDYSCSTHPKLLLLGESFYFPEDSTIHKDPVSWYSTNQSALNEEEVLYIDCRGLLECDWGSPGHKMYREINNCLEELGLPSQDRPVSHICYTNTFLRPAHESGASFKYCCVDQDIQVSIDVLTRVISALSPAIVIFASKYAWDAVGCRLAGQFTGLTFEFVSHPTDPFHWNVESYDHGRAKFLALLNRWTTKPT